MYTLATPFHVANVNSVVIRLPSILYFPPILHILIDRQV
jgi:hypothetical protein